MDDGVGRQPIACDDDGVAGRRLRLDPAPGQVVPCMSTMRPRRGAHADMWNRPPDRGGAGSSCRAHRRAPSWVAAVPIVMQSHRRARCDLHLRQSLSRCCRRGARPNIEGVRAEPSTLRAIPPEHRAGRHEDRRTPRWWAEQEPGVVLSQPPHQHAPSTGCERISFSSPWPGSCGRASVADLALEARSRQLHREPPACRMPRFTPRRVLKWAWHWSVGPGVDDRMTGLRHSLRPHSPSDSSASDAEGAKVVRGRTSARCGARLVSSGHRPIRACGMVLGWRPRALRGHILVITAGELQSARSPEAAKASFRGDRLFGWRLCSLRRQAQKPTPVIARR